VKSNTKLIGASVLSAFAASLCCITPVLAFIAGTSGLVSTFSWVEPLRPYLIGLTTVVLAFAWYQNLRPQKLQDCECDPNEKKPFFQSRLFLGIVTCFTICMLAFPYYSFIFYPNTVNNTIFVDKQHVAKVEFAVDGMTCSGCEDHVNIEVRKVDGVFNSITSYESGNTIVEYDNSKTNIFEIENAIKTTGYTVSKLNEE
jgi:copper chaperone CopZ